jgi:hypothetical protein
VDWNAAIEKHREALKRIVAALVAIAGLAGADSALRACGDATLPRHLHRTVLRLLRPAESAARRLVIALARGFSAPPQRLRKAGPKPPQSPPGAPTAARPLACPVARSAAAVERPPPACRAFVCPASPSALPSRSASA